MAEEPQALNTYCQVPIKKVPLKKTSQITCYFNICPFRSESETHAQMNMWNVCFWFCWNTCFTFPGVHRVFWQEATSTWLSMWSPWQPIGLHTKHLWVNEWAHFDPIGIAFLTSRQSHPVSYHTTPCSHLHHSFLRDFSTFYKDCHTVSRQIKSQRTDYWGPEFWFSLNYLLLL